MSQENVELMREFAEAWERGDVETMEALFQGRVGANFEFQPLYLDRADKGAEVRQMWADITGTWEDYRSEVEEILDLGEHVLTVARITGHGASGGVPIDQRIFILSRFQGETAVWAKSFASKEEALEAVGMRE
jgi:ketosteroid isomerase-like protein